MDGRNLEGEVFDFRSRFDPVDLGSNPHLWS